MNLYDLILCTNHILFESFKSDLIDTYNKNGVQVDGNQKLLSAVQIFNNDNLIKDKVKKDLKNPPNIAIALVNSFPNPQDLIEYIVGVQQSFVEKDQQNKEKKQRKEQAASASNGFYVYPCHTFEEAHSAAFSHTGSLERLSNEEIKKKYKINVPNPDTYYRTTKSPAEMLEFMKSAPFFMSPSWCIAANRNFWNDYRLDSDKSPKCYVIISKQCPNVRFCIALSNVTGINIEENGFELFGKKDILEVRDTWQCGAEDTVNTGMEMLKIAFPDADKIIQNILHTSAKIIDFAKFKHINTNEITDFKQLQDELNYAFDDSAFQGNLEYASDDQPQVCKFNIKSLPNLEIATYGLSNDRIEEFTCDMPKLYDGYCMFYYSRKLKKFSSNIKSLINANNMFYNCTSLKTFTNPMPNLKRGREMFSNCTNLETFTSPTPNLENGSDMFYNCTSLKTFSGDLSALVNGEDMFYGCPLDKKSVMHIVSSINIAPEGRLSPITIGYAKGQLTDEEITKLKNQMKDKNWDCLFLES